MKFEGRDHKGLIFDLYLDEPDDMSMHLYLRDATVHNAIYNILVERGEVDVNAKITRLFLESRVFPPDRQNIGVILREMGLPRYSITGQLICMQGGSYDDDIRIFPLAPISELNTYFKDGKMPMEVEKILKERAIKYDVDFHY